MIDYAYPTMMAEKALKDLHLDMLDKKYDEACKQALEALDKIAEIYLAIRYMQNNDKT
tara:strand:+ start:74 stop:247 length:174 start_codon:yes stop_codon:yes gene_type:complete